jgi:hypothetical protein
MSGDTHNCYNNTSLSTNYLIHEMVYISRNQSDRIHTHHVLFHTGDTCLCGWLCVNPCIWMRVY